MSRIFWDTNLFIYLFERDQVFFPATDALLQRMLLRRDALVTSCMTLGEVQTGPLRNGKVALAARYRAAVRLTCEVVAFDERAADLYAAIRLDKTIKAPDAIQLSCAGAAGVEVFVTNDRALLGVRVPGIHFVTSLERVPV